MTMVIFTRKSGLHFSPRFRVQNFVTTILSIQVKLFDYDLTTVLHFMLITEILDSWFFKTTSDSFEFVMLISM